jgi:uncharacterized protein with GYD domain
MLKFVATFAYSSGSWARMLQTGEDRTASVAALLEHFHGSLESIYWEVETASAHVIANLPDSISATAVIADVTRTGAFKEVRVHEVLTQAQLRDVVALARTSEGVYRAPGAEVVETDF